MMTGLWLFLKSRRVIALLGALALVAIVGRLLGGRSFRLGEEESVIFPWVLLLAPAASAYAIAGAVVSPFPVLEMLASRGVSRIARLYLVTTAAIAVLLLWWATQSVPPPLSTPSALRAFVGLLGVSLIAIAMLGVTVAWVVPCGLLFSAIVLLNGNERFFLIDWIVGFDDDAAALVTALVLLIIGVSATWTRSFQLRNAAD